MLVKTIIDEDFSNYRVPSMFIASCYCNFKCCKEADIPITVCQNQPILQQPIIKVSADEIFRRYQENPITSAIVIGGLEPILQNEEVIETINYFRKNEDYSPFVIYTGYYPEEIKNEINQYQRFKNIILKVGRFIPGHKPHYDDVLGVQLISDNQYGVKIS